MGKRSWVLTDKEEASRETDRNSTYESTGTWVGPQYQIFLQSTCASHCASITVPAVAMDAAKRSAR